MNIALGTLGLWMAYRLYCLRPKRIWLKATLQLFLFWTIYLLINPGTLNVNKRTLNIADNTGTQTLLSKSGIKTSTQKLLGEKINLYGTDFDIDYLASLRGSKTSFFPSFKPNEIQEINWPGIINQYENLEVTLSMRADKKFWIKLSRNGKTVDSTLTKIGSNKMKLNSLIHTAGKNKLQLKYDNQTRDINVFVQKTPAMKVNMYASSPNIEFKTLAEWLTKNGHEVFLNSKISKERSISNLKSAFKTPDLLICDPNSLKSKPKNGGVLIMNLDAVTSNLASINTFYGTHFIVKKTNSVSMDKEDVFLPILSQGLNHSADKKIFESSKIAVSLHQDSYTHWLAGDTITYQNQWGIILNLFSKGNLSLFCDGPKLQNIPLHIHSEGTESILQLDQTTLFKQNGYSKVFKNAGWKTLADSLAVHIDSMLYPDQHYLKMESFNATQSHNSNVTWKNQGSASESLFWYIFGLLALIWIESKIP